MIEPFPIGARVELLGVHQRARVACEDGGCDLAHFAGTAVNLFPPRYHYIEEVTGRGAVVVDYEPGAAIGGDPRVLIRFDDRSEVSCDLVDLRGV